MKESLDTTSGLSSFLLESAARINRKPDPVSAWRYPCLRDFILSNALRTYLKAEGLRGRIRYHDHSCLHGPRPSAALHLIAHAPLALARLFLTRDWLLLSQVIPRSSRTAPPRAFPGRSVTIIRLNLGPPFAY
ncbi:hypothetical protein CB1_001178010 [Camelus ferus]|nr:hypothetical protein CB1_001178010 [Camelus ferus]